MVRPAEVYHVLPSGDALGLWLSTRQSLPPPAYMLVILHRLPSHSRLDLASFALSPTFAATRPCICTPDKPTGTTMGKSCATFPWDVFPAWLCGYGFATYDVTTSSQTSFSRHFLVLYLPPPAHHLFSFVSWYPPHKFLPSLQPFLPHYDYPQTCTTPQKQATI